MDKGPTTGDIWEFTTHDNQHIYFLIGDIAPDKYQFDRDRATLIVVCDTTDDGMWGRERVTSDLVDMITDRTYWRRVA